jgi:hypothetical protein
VRYTRRAGNARVPTRRMFDVRGHRRCQRIIYQLADSRPGSLLTDRAIDRFAEKVCVAGVAGSLLDEVQQHPPEREVPPVTQRPSR